MKNQKSVQLFEVPEIQSRIVAVRSIQVMLDRDLAVLYGVQTKVLNQAVKRNIGRFPERFMFRLVESEMRELVTKCDRFENLKHSVVPMYAFTEQGVAMLSAVLRSKIAIDVSIRIMDAFVAMRRFAYDHAGLVQRVGAIELKQLETDKRIDTVFDALDRGNLLPSGILPAESEFDSLRYVTRLIESAESEIVLIDPYSDVVTLEVLSKKRPGVKVRLVCKNRGKPTPTSAKTMFCLQSGNGECHVCLILEYRRLHDKIARLVSCGGGRGGDEGLARTRGGDFHGALLKWGLNVRIEYRFSPSM